MAVNFLQWLFGLAWWGAFKAFCSVAAPTVCVIGVVWYVYDRVTGGV